LASREEVFDQVKEILVERLEVEESDVSMDASLRDDLKADSLDQVELIMDIEERFGIKIPDEDAQSLGTVGDAVDYIVEHAAG
jgi:acyl carrier protein